MRHAIALILILLLFGPASNGDDNDKPEIPPKIRMIRAYGGDDEKTPPIIIKDAPNYSIKPPMGSSRISFEFDVKAEVPPSLYARFFHCSVDWNESENVFLNDIVHSRTSNIRWTSGPTSARFYSYRGKITVPNSQVKFKFSGNWKMKLYRYGADSVPIAEVKFFVLQPKTICQTRLISDFYDPKHNFITSSAFTVEARVKADQRILDNQLNTVVLYRNFRWSEPYYISNRKDYGAEEKYRYRSSTTVAGFATAWKIFRIANLPAENEYRVLDLSNLASYPNVNNAVRKPMSDIRRRGNYLERDDDGAMITNFISHHNDNYVNFEFLLDPDNWITEREVYVVGSFNNWTPTPEWQMYYDEEKDYYRLRQIVKRAKHNYMYATGTYDNMANRVERIAYDEYEGNTTMTSHTYLTFVYYRNYDYGGYDELIGLGASSVYGEIRR